MATWTRRGRSASGDDILTLRPEEIRQLPERQALVIAESTRPIIAKLTRAVDGKPGRKLPAQQRDARGGLADRQGNSGAIERGFPATGMPDQVRLP